MDSLSISHITTYYRSLIIELLVGLLNAEVAQNGGKVENGGKVGSGRRKTGKEHDRYRRRDSRREGYKERDEHRKLKNSERGRHE